MEAPIYTRLRASLQLNDVLHRFRERRGTGVSIMELKIAQELYRIDQYTLFLVFLDLRNYYETVDLERLLITLEGYVAGPCLCGHLEILWDRQQVVPIYNGFHRMALSEQ